MSKDNPLTEQDFNKIDGVVESAVIREKVASAKRLLLHKIDTELFPGSIYNEDKAKMYMQIRSMIDACFQIADGDDKE
jgi:hypothetical protein